MDLITSQNGFIKPRPYPFSLKLHQNLNKN